MDNLTNAYSNMQKEEDKKVFYGQRDIIERPGFDSIESFDKGIKDVKNEISDYDELLLENQRKLKEIVKEEEFYKVHPEVALPGEVSKLHDMYVSLIDKKKMLLEKQEKSKKNLMELEEAKKEFIREKRKTNKNEINDKMSLLDEHSRKQQEIKELEYKISNGVANEFEKERYNVLKNEIVPEIEKKLKNEHEEDVIYQEVQNNNTVSSEISKDSNDEIYHEVIGKQDSEVIPEIRQENVVVKGATRPANLFEVVTPNENFKVKSQERKLVGAYPLTVEDLEKNSGFEKEKKKTVMKIITAPKKIFDSIKRKFQEHLEKKEQKQLECQIIEDKLSNSGDFEVEPPVIEKEYEEIINERPNTVNTENNPEVTKVFAR